MAVQTRDTLKSYFQTGDIPTQSQFGDLIDTIVIGTDITVAKTIQDKTWTIKTLPSGNPADMQKPEGNTLQDGSLQNVTPLGVIFIDNLPLQWVAAGVIFNSSSGKFDFTSSTYGALKNNSVITIQYNS